jgi:hypothetical protein
MSNAQAPAGPMLAQKAKMPFRLVVTKPPKRQAHLEAVTAIRAKALARLTATRPVEAGKNARAPTHPVEAGKNARAPTHPAEAGKRPKVCCLMSGAAPSTWLLHSSPPHRHVRRIFPVQQESRTRD